MASRGIDPDRAGAPDVADAVLAELADRDEGLTVFELRTHVGCDIDALEAALSDLKDEGRIRAEETGGRTTITAAADAPADEGRSVLDRVRELV
jgi:hypothetical protein